MDHVLIVEDHEENRNLLALLLKVNGYRVTTAGDGLEALSAARRDLPDAVVSDVLMPKMDGFALCRAWMQDPALRRIPFIFYSATYVRPDDEQFALALGAVRYLIKPVEAEVFLRELRTVLQQWTGRAAPTPPAPLDEATSHALHEAVLARKLEDKMAQLEQAERKLRESEERYQRMCDYVQDVYVETSVEGTILEMSPQVATLSKGQYKREDLIGTSVDALYADAGYRNRILQTIKQHGRAIDMDSVFRNRDGSHIPCSVSAMIVRCADGELRTVATLRDVTERKAAERATSGLRELVEQLFAGIFVAREQELVFCNARFAQILGYASAAELIGRDLLSIPIERDVKAMAESLRLCEQEPGPVSRSVSAARKDGAVIELEFQVVRATYLGEPACIGMVQDLSGKPRAG